MYEGPNRQLSAVRNFLPNGEESSYFIYSYDKRGRITTLTTENGVWTYIYDPASQLQLVKWKMIPLSIHMTAEVIELFRQEMVEKKVTVSIV